MIWVDPDELKSTSHFPTIKDVREQRGLEALTGADFVLSRIPLPINESTLKAHIQAHSLFVQRKHAYDILSFDKLHSSIARLKACNIPQQQAILLFIGHASKSVNGKLRVDGKHSYGETTYETFIKLKAKWRFRGGVVDWLDNADELELWAQAQLDALDDVIKQGARDLYPSRNEPLFEGDDILQPMVEVPHDDMRYFLCAGLYGFGPKLAQSVDEYVKSELPHVNKYGVYYLKVLTDQNEKHKAKHNIRGWGDKSRKALRAILGLPDGYNLSVESLESDSGRQFANGWYGALDSFRKLVESGLNGVEAWKALMKETDDFFKADV